MRRDRPTLARFQNRCGAVAVLGLAIVIVPGFVGVVSTQIVDGLLGFEQVQSITGSSGWGGICPSDQQNGRCMWSSGFAFVPSTGRILMTTTEAQYTNDLSPTSDGHNYSLVFNSTTAPQFSSLSLPCASADPYYPGVGPAVYIPCQPPTPSSNNASILTIDLATNQVVGSFPMKGWWSNWGGSQPLAWDPTDGLLYACDRSSSTLWAINTTSENVVFTTVIQGGCQWPVYDPAANVLLVSGADAFGGAYGDGLNVVIPMTGVVVQTIFTGGVTTASVDPSAGWIAVGIESPADSRELGSVVLINASTFGPMATVPLSPVPGTGASIPEQILVDPNHGDLYAVAWGNVFAINLTTDQVIVDLVIPGNLGAFPSIYVASTDSIFVPDEGLIVTVAMSHWSNLELTSLLWLPVSAGILVVSGFGGVAVIVGLRSSRVRHPRNRGPRSEPTPRRLNVGSRP